VYIVASDDLCGLRLLSGEEGEPTLWEGERYGKLFITGTGGALMKKGGREKPAEMSSPGRIVEGKTVTAPGTRR
jgi:hypothetical protein